MKIRSIFLRAFPPFRAQQLTFPASPESSLAEVHFLVGENGTGKTRLLSLLAASFGNASELQERAPGNADAMVVAGASNGPLLFWNRGHVMRTSHSLEVISGHYFAGRQMGDLGAGEVGKNFMSGQPPTVAMAFRAVASIKDVKLKPLGAVDLSKQNDWLLFAPVDVTGQTLSQALANMKLESAMYLAANEGAPPDRLTRLLKTLEDTLRAITGRQLVFSTSGSGEEMRLVARWGNTRMQVQQLPDGLRAIVGWLVLCVARLHSVVPPDTDPLSASIVLLLDEPETHLHPAWQRRLIPALQRLLPNAQIFIATHSPFIVSSVNHGWITRFIVDSEGFVEGHEPKACGLGDTYMDAVEEVLGVREMYDPETEELLSAMRIRRDDAKRDPTLEKLRAFELQCELIGRRSESLSFMMGRELSQFRQQVRQQVSKESL